MHGDGGGAGGPSIGIFRGLGCSESHDAGSTITAGQGGGGFSPAGSSFNGQNGVSQSTH